ncbi:hypothetical protein BD289DRAFT_457252 [Coniella lustricola]|uniref:Uncharacterized protein n=1 Tax=Coniella lustricola TaxID=2025994 RepID=A0A2T2ZSM3_9PEZI|nr:hypothetical protein BD289DRAFT_457252 [Coniella lustricola]
MGFFHHHEKEPEHPPPSYSSQSNYAPSQQQQQQQQQQYQAPSSSSAGPHPFSIFSSPQDPNFLVFHIADLGKGHDALVSTNHGPANPAYRIDYTSDGFQCLRAFDGTTTLAGAAVSRKQTTSTQGRIHLDYPWGKWDYNPLLGTELWKSDVGLLNNAGAMSWHLLKPAEAQSTGRFAARCYDTSAAAYPLVASFEMDNWDRGTLRVFAPIVRTPQQLDEMVVLAFAVMDYLRVVVRSTGGVQRRPGAGGNNNQQFWMTMALSQQAQNQQAGGGGGGGGW